VRSIVFADAAIALTEPTPTFRAIVERRLKEPVPTLEVALKWREEAKLSSFTKVAQTNPEVRAVLDRMVDQYSPRVLMNPQKSDSTSAMDTSPWNGRDYPDMATFYQPMLLVVGERSDDLFINAAKEAHRLWPNSRYAMIPGVDHLLSLEAPEAFNELALTFLTDVEAIIEARRKWNGYAP
jgi:pimeloyl-ACP methyl ester carboxylesterase